MLWGCIGKNIAHCSINLQFLPVMCVLCPCCARRARAVRSCAHAPPREGVQCNVVYLGGCLSMRG